MLQQGNSDVWFHYLWLQYMRLTHQCPVIFLYFSELTNLVRYQNGCKHSSDAGQLNFDRSLCNATALTHWGRVTHICVGNLTIIGPDNGLSPGRRQAIIWTNAGILLIEPWGTNFSEILIGIQTFSFKKIHLKMSSVKLRPFCLGFNVLMPRNLLFPSYAIASQWSRHMAVQIWVDIGSDNGLLPDGTKPLPNSMVTYHQWGAVTFTWELYI